MTTQTRDEAVYMGVVGFMLCMYLGAVVALLTF
jgi:hypothetical protein